jgi:hypothetical protein
MRSASGARALNPIAEALTGEGRNHVSPLKKTAQRDQ